MAATENEAEVRQRIYQWMKGKGLPQWLKTEFRSKVAHDLQLEQGPVRKKATPSPLKNSIVVGVVNKLVINYLKKAKFEYTHSLFLSESGSSKEVELKVEDFLSYLHVPVGSHLDQQIRDSASKVGLLVSLIEGLTHHFVSDAHTVASVETQTTDVLNWRTPIAQRLLNVEAKYTSLASQHELEGQNSVEDHLLSCQRHWEEWARKQVKDEVQRIRDVELAQVKLAEREKYDKELATLREELHQDYKEKINNLRKLEFNLQEQVRRKEEEIDSSLFHQRQSMLKEMDILQRRETELTRQRDLSLQSARYEEERLKTLLEEIHQREASLNAVCEDYVKQLNDTKTQCERELERTNLLHEEDIRKMEVKLKAKECQVEELMSHSTELKAKVEQSQSDLRDLETALHRATNDQVTLQKQKEQLQEKLDGAQDSAQLKRQLEDRQGKLDSANRQLELLRENSEQREEELKKCLHEATAKLAKPSSELINLRAEIHAEKESRRRDLHRNNVEREKLQKALFIMKDKNGELIHAVHESNLKLKDAHREIEDLKSQISVLERAVDSYLKRSLTKSPLTVQQQQPPAVYKHSKPLNVAISKKVLRFSELPHHTPRPAPVPAPTLHRAGLSHQPSRAATTVTHAHSGPTAVTKTSLEDAQEIYSRLDQVAKELEQSYSRMTDQSLCTVDASDNLGSAASYLHSPSPDYPYGILVQGTLTGETPEDFDSATPTEEEADQQLDNVSFHHPESTTHPPQATTHPPQATTHPPQATTHPPQATTHPPQATTHPPQATTHPPQATTYLPKPVNQDVSKALYQRSNGLGALSEVDRQNHGNLAIFAAETGQNMVSSGSTVRVTSCSRVEADVQPQGGFSEETKSDKLTSVPQRQPIYSTYSTPPSEAIIHLSGTSESLKTLATTSTPSSVMPVMPTPIYSNHLVTTSVHSVHQSHAQEISLDSLWQQNTLNGSNLRSNTTTSLDKQAEASKLNNSPISHPHSSSEILKDLPTTVVISGQDDLEWERRRKERLAEKQRKKEEEYQKYLKDMEELQKQEHNLSIANSEEKDNVSQYERNFETEKEPILQQEKEPIVQQEREPILQQEEEVDPVMQRYMKLVMEKRENEKKQQSFPVQNQPEEQKVTTNGEVDEFGIPLPPDENHSFGDVVSGDDPFEDW